MVTTHVYYLAATREVHGPSNPWTKAYLFARFMRHFPVDADRPHHADGASMFVADGDGETIERVIVGGKVVA